MSKRRITANDMPEKVASGEMTLDEYITTMQRKKKLIDRLIATVRSDWEESDREDLRKTPLPLVEDVVSREQGVSMSEAGEDIPTSNVESADPDDFGTGEIAPSGPTANTASAATDAPDEVDVDDFGTGVIE